MNAIELKQNIQQRIEIIDQSFTESGGKSYHAKYCVDDMHSLEKELSKVKLRFRIYHIFVIICMCTFLSFYLWKIINPATFNVDLLGFITLFVLISTLRAIHYKLKVNLEDKIYLLKLTKKIEQD